ncbi:MAG: amino acid dehydrogenase [Myxococcales bacterium]
MEWFAQMAEHDFGELHVKRDAASGLCAIVAIHDVRLGPALGGCRFIEYAHERDALRDALRLSRGMTYKAALAGVPFGGGKSVIMRPHQAFDRTHLFRAFGRFVDELGGRYITAEDSGTTLEDMAVIRSVTRHVTGAAQSHGGSGDPSPSTALGVRRGLEAAVRFALGKTSLVDVHVAVQGVGNVGYHLCRELRDRGARLTVADVDPHKVERVVQEFAARAVSLDEIYRVDCDVFAPCALGGALNDDTIPKLKCKVVAGAANNQLAESRHGEQLRERDIVYAPDYAINAGGLIHVAQETMGYDPLKVRSRTERIYDTILEILERAEAAGCPSQQIADAMVEEKLARSPMSNSVAPLRLARAKA